MNDLRLLEDSMNYQEDCNVNKTLKKKTSRTYFKALFKL